MSNIFMGIAWISGAITWLLTIYYAFLNWGLLAALAAFFLPPIDIIFMFMLGTWQFGLVAIAAMGLAIMTSKD
jgi:hypothetical protein